MIVSDIYRFITCQDGLDVKQNSISCVAVNAAVLNLSDCTMFGLYSQLRIPMM